MYKYTFYYTKLYKMLTIRTNEYQNELIAYLRLHKVRFTPKLKQVITKELESICKDFKMKGKRIHNAPDWLYD